MDSADFVDDSDYSASQQASSSKPVKVRNFLYLMDSHRTEHTLANTLFSVSD